MKIVINTCLWGARAAELPKFEKQIINPMHGVRRLGARRRLFSTASTKVEQLPEVVSSALFPQRLTAALNEHAHAAADLEVLEQRGKDAGLLLLRASMATTHLHTQSRIAAFMGSGFYTIGPCGEELMAAVGLALRPTDPAALHYRHLGTLIARQLVRGHDLEGILLDRARGYTTSTRDPVTGGAHCSLGADVDADFLVTSTLASQGPQAVGRAMAIEHLRAPRWPSDAISFVSCGDGSINNSEWLSAVNAAELLAYRRRACPILFCITDNGLSISLKTTGWTDRWLGQRLGMQTFHVANATCAGEMVRVTAEAAEYVRRTRKPATLLVSNVPRRFGHAATDRQSAYLTADEIQAAQAKDPVAHAAAALVHAGMVSEADALAEYRMIGEMTAAAFETAKGESREMDVTGLIGRTAPAPATRAGVATAMAAQTNADGAAADAAPSAKALPKAPMRTLMTRALSAALAADDALLYMGEDVEHGGYYLVTEGLTAKYGRRRVFDWPPDEASLIGAAIGVAQSGRVPICELPYAAYLSCGYNQFVEACFLHWLSNGRQPNGLVFRMQGFDEGVFGGHFHTANAPPVFGIPGIDVLCHSNGYDWARGFDGAVRRAHSGAVTMLLDSTALLNRRHVCGRDDQWQFESPGPGETLVADDVILYPSDGGFRGVTVSACDGETAAEEAAEMARISSGKAADTVVVTYGNGVVKALQARAEQSIMCDVIDTPLLSRCPAALPKLLRAMGYERLLFVDVCREGAGPLSHFASHMQQHASNPQDMASAVERTLPSRWRLLCAPPTYNPLGRTLTFVSSEGIAEALRTLAEVP